MTPHVILSVAKNLLYMRVREKVVVAVLVVAVALAAKTEGKLRITDIGASADRTLVSAYRLVSSGLLRRLLIIFGLLPGTKTRKASKTFSCGLSEPGFSHLFTGRDAAPVSGGHKEYQKV